MIDRDLAELYQVPTKVLNQAVNRNIERFPEAFKFQLNSEEKDELVTNCDRFKNLKHSSTNPYAFTEQGVAMLSAVLRSSIAINVSIQIMGAFVEMRKILIKNASLLQRMEKMEAHQLQNNENFERIFKALEGEEINPKQGVFFDGQVFDAYSFVSKLIRNARTSIILIDNYVDDSVLTLLTKKQEQVEVLILSKNISKQLSLDVQKANMQYPKIQVKAFQKAHDRFLIIDQKEVYHIGASLKDLGKKWFAFSKIEADSLTVLESVKKLI
jgi:hypothetical protein